MAIRQLPDCLRQRTPRSRPIRRDSSHAQVH